MNDADVVDLINRAVEVAVQRAQRSLAQPQFLVGTIALVDAEGPGLHEVLLDGDEETVVAVNITTMNFQEGHRAAVVATLPHQMWIVGRVETAATSDWQPYIPTIGGVFGIETTLPKRGRFAKTGNTVIVEGGFTLDAIHDIVGTITVSLPVPAHLSADGIRWLAGARAFDAVAGGRWASIGFCDPAVDANTIVNFGTAGATGPWGATVPFDWFDGAVFDFFITYEAANSSA